MPLDKIVAEVRAVACAGHPDYDIGGHGLE
jgi:hypothetical protein